MIDYLLSDFYNINLVVSEKRKRKCVSNEAKFVLFIPANNKVCFV